MTRRQEVFIRWAMFALIFLGASCCLYFFLFFAWAADFPVDPRRDQFLRLTNIYGVLFAVSLVAAIVILTANIRWHLRSR